MTRLDDLGVARLAARAGLTWSEVPLDFADAPSSRVRLWSRRPDRAAETRSSPSWRAIAPTTRCYQRKRADRRTPLLVDPLDGTVNFLHASSGSRLHCSTTATSRSSVWWPTSSTTTYWVAAGEGAWSTSGELSAAERRWPNRSSTGQIPLRPALPRRSTKTSEAVLGRASNHGWGQRRSTWPQKPPGGSGLREYGWDSGRRRRHPAGTRAGGWSQTTAPSLVRGTPPSLRLHQLVQPDLLRLVASHLPEHLR